MPLVNVADLTKPQRSVVESVPRGVKYVQGPAGTGKTTVGVRRMLRLLTKDKVFANEILVLVPQRALALPYIEGEQESRLDAGGRITYTTLGGLAKNIVDLFFPLIAEQAGFNSTRSRPTFLTLETAQYHMARVVSPLLDEQAYFDMIAITRNRLYSQIIDNLNKAAVVGFPHEDVGQMLIDAWGGKDPAQVTVYRQMQECVMRFRDYCLQHNLVDFSLQVELFHQLWDIPAVRGYLTTKYRHLIVDNIEEDTPVTHDILLDWLQEAESTLLIRDTEAGFRRFLGASPKSADRLSEVVTTNRDYFALGPKDSFVTTPDLRRFGAELAVSLGQAPPEDNTPDGNPRAAFDYEQPRFHTHMLQIVAERIAELVHVEGVPPDEIVVLAPFLSDSLRFTLTERLNEQDVPYRSHRPSRALREEPVTGALLTWAQLAHAEWNMRPSEADVIHALMESIAGLDLVRAQLIADVLYRKRALQSFDALASGLQERITYAFGEKVEALHRWLAGYAAEPVDEIDLFWSRLFGEVLTKSGFGFQQSAERARVAANLIDSARGFRHVMGDIDIGRALGQEYVQMVRDGVIADQYIRDWAGAEESTGLLAPAYTFLMMNRPVQYQFWLNVGGSGWWERLYQPLTHPYVLTREWHGGIWTDEHEYYTQNEAMFRLVLGLIRRCGEGVFLGFSELGEQGYEQRGKLLGAVQDMLRRLLQDGEGVA